MRQEERLIVTLARGHWREAAAQPAVRLRRSELDWAEALRLSRCHEVVPLVHHNLDRLGVGAVPTAIQSALAAGHRTVAARNGLLARELADVLRALSAAGVPAIPLKGVSLAERLYGDSSLRDCADIDVLVPRACARDALAALRACGYAAEFAERFFEALLLHGHIEYTLKRRDRAFEYVVDLHWGIGWSARGDRRAAEALWRDARPTTRAGVPVHVMSPEWEYLTLAVHAARHGWRPLKWLVDVHDYCSSQPLDWSKAREIAHRFGWLPAVEQTLGACRLFFDMPISPSFSAVQPVGWLPTLEPQPKLDVPDTVLALRVMARPHRTRYLLEQLFRPTLAERRLVRLPPALRLLYYPIRPVRLAGKWAWRFLQRLGALRPMRSGSCVLASRQP